MGKGERILYSAPALPIRRLELAWLRRDENPRLPVLRRLKNREEDYSLPLHGNSKTEPELRSPTFSKKSNKEDTNAG